MIYRNDDTRKNVLEGAELLYDIVKTTLGPKGRNVLIKDKFGGFTVTHDGVTVAKAVQLKDDPKSVGVEIIKEASKKMDTIGDGTTSVTVLTYHLMVEANKLIEGGANPMMIKRELGAKVPELIEAIEARTKKIEKSTEEVKAVATVSVGNAELGSLVADLLTEVGFDGAITVEATNTPETTAKVVQGYNFDRGYLSPYFVTDQSSREAKLRNPAVILINGVVSDLEQYKNVLDILFEQNIKDVLIVAENFDVDPLNTLILNKVKGTLNVCAVKTPGMGDAKFENLRDIAAVTGAKIIDPEVGDWQNSLGLNTLGAAEKIIVGFDETVIIGGQGDVTERAAKLKKRIRKVKEDEKEAILERVAKLTGKVGVIKVGGQTDTDVEEKKYRIDDAVAAVKAAMRGGIVAGGGVTLRDIAYATDWEGDTEQALVNALLMPEQILLENSGFTPESMTHFTEGWGRDVLTGKDVEMIEFGVIDPADVTKEVVRNAITTACLAITVGGSIVETQLTTEEMTNLMGKVG